MRLTLASLVITTVLIGGCLCPPPPLIHKTEPKKHIPGASVNEIEEDVNKVTEDKKVDTEIDDLGLEYGRYLNEVVKALDDDPEFAKKMENITHDQIISGEVARQIEMVAPEVRNRLDELKRIEMDRLRKLAMKEHNLELQMENEHSDGAYERDGRKWRTVNKPKTTGHVQIDAHHIDHQNPHTFEAEDLQKLILQATNDLEELDRKRRRDFKQYEMEKEIHYRESLQNMTAEQKHEAERKHEEEKRKHQQHGHVNAPGSKNQFEEVWEEQDHMRKEDFNPKVFFQMHDLTNDGFWDQEEVEAMLSGEVKKLYDDKDPHTDKNEMQEEFHRMREHIYQEIDTNHDGLISKKEFLDYAHSTEFQKDDGWKSVEEAPVYTEEELKQYEQHRQQLQDHYAKYGAYQVAYDPVQLAYQQAVMQGGATHNGQPVQYVMGQPQHVQNVQYHHVELPPQHNIHYVPQGQVQGQYQALPPPQQGQPQQGQPQHAQPQIAGQSHPPQGAQYMQPNQQQQYHAQVQQQQYHAPPPPQAQYQAPPAQGQYQQQQHPPQYQQQQPPPPQQQYGQANPNQHYQTNQQPSQPTYQQVPVGNQQQQQQQQHYQPPPAGQQQQQYHPPPQQQQQQQQQRPK